MFCHLHRLPHYYLNISALVSRIKPSIYRVTCFTDGHQTWHYSNDYHASTIDPWWSRQRFYPIAGERDVSIETNNTELPQFGIISCNNELSFNKLHSFSFSTTSLFYIEFSITSRYKLLYKRGMDTKISAHIGKIVSKKDHCQNQSI